MKKIIQQIKEARDRMSKNFSSITKPGDDGHHCVSCTYESGNLVYHIEGRLPGHIYGWLCDALIVLILKRIDNGQSIEQITNSLELDKKIIDSGIFGINK